MQQEQELMVYGAVGLTSVLLLSRGYKWSGALGLASIAWYHGFQTGKQSKRKEQPSSGKQQQQQGDNAEMDEFQRAVNFASNGLGRIDTEKQLKLYGLFKQATVGVCNTTKPSLVDMVGSAKWKAWNGLGEMSKDDAKAAYVAFVSELKPGWNKANEKTSRNLSSSNEQSGGGGGGGMAPTVSTFAVEDEAAPKGEAEELMGLAGKGDLTELLNRLQRSKLNPQDVRGEDGETLLHMACDRGDVDMIHALMKEASIDIEAKDIDGLTPLAYALMNDHEDVARFLVNRYGADPNVCGNDGEPILKLSSRPIEFK